MSRTMGNVAALVVMQTTHAATGFLVTTVLLARWLGTDGFGLYGFINSVLVVFAFASNLGMHILLTRQIARDPKDAAIAMGSGMGATMALSLGTALAIIGYVQVMDGRPFVVGLALLGAVGLGLRSMWHIAQAVLHGLRRMDLQLPGVLVGRSVYVVMTIGLLMSGYGVASVLAAQAIAAAVTLGFFAAAIRTASPHAARWNPSEARHLIRLSVPFGLNMLFGAIYLQSDALILQATHGENELGLYRAAAGIVTHLLVLAYILNKGIFPKMSGFLDDPVAAGREMTFATRILLAVSVPIAIGGLCVADGLVEFLFGTPYAAATLPLIVMLPLLPLRFVNNGFGMALSSLNHQSERTRAVFYAALFNLITNLVAIPRWGAVGAATTTLLTECLLIAGFAYYLLPLLREFRMWGPVVKSIVPALPMAAVILAIAPYTHVLTQIGIGAAVYMGAGVLSGAVRRTDLQHLRDL